MSDGQGPLAPGEQELQQALVAGDLPEPEPAIGGTFQMPPEMLHRPTMRAEWSPTAQAYVDPESRTVIGAGSSTAGAGGMAPVPATMPAMPGMGLGAGGGGAGEVPEIEPPAAVEHRARMALGEQGVQTVQRLREQGVSEEQIRARLGMRPPPAATAPAQVLTMPGIGAGMMRRPEPPLPEELQRPYETLYPSDYASRVAAAAVAGEIEPEQARKMMEGFEAWQKSPLGVRAAEQERQLGVAEQAGELGQQRLAAEQQAAEQQKALLDQQRAQQEAEANAQRAWQEDFDREMTDQTARYERAIEEAKRARIDPDRARIPIVDSLAIALGQFAAIMTGTPNAAMQLINQRLDRDIAAQEREIKTLEGNVAARHNRLGMLRQRFGDQQQALQAEKRLQLEQVSTELQRIATGSKVEANRIGAQQLALALDDQIGRMKAEEQQAHAVASQELANMRHQQRLAAANQLALQRQRAQQAAEMQASGMGPWQTGKGVADLRKRYIPGYGFAATAKTRDEVQAKLNQIDSSMDAAKQLIAIGESGAASLDPKKRAQAKSLAASAAVGLGVMYNLGALSEADLAITKDIIRSPAEVTSIGAIESMKQSLRTMQAERGRVLRGVHVTPGEFGTIADPKTGEPVEAARLALPGRGPAGPQQITEMQHQAR